VRVCPDINVWLEWSRSGSAHLGPGDGRWRVFLATIVLQEIWAGTRTPDERRYAERLHALAHRYRRVLNPAAAAWILSGQAIGLLAQRHHVPPRRLRALRNDVLLAATAMVHGAAVLTRNLEDFRLVAKVLRVRLLEPRAEV